MQEADETDAVMAEVRGRYYFRDGSVVSRPTQLPVSPASQAGEFSLVDAALLCLDLHFIITRNNVLKQTF